MKLSFPKHIPEKSLLGRVFGPDTVGGHSYVYSVCHTDEGTFCLLKPLAPEEVRITKDEHDQWRVAF